MELRIIKLSDDEIIVEPRDGGPGGPTFVGSLPAALAFVARYFAPPPPPTNITPEA